MTNFKNQWNDLSEAVPVENPAKSLTKKELSNPYHPATCFVLYLYSLELGNPPLYAELNRVIR